MSAHALQQAGLGALSIPEGPGAIYVSARLGAPSPGLAAMAIDEAGEIIARARLAGDTRLLARLPIPDGLQRTIKVELADEAGTTPSDILDLRVEPRPASDTHALSKWRPIGGAWIGDALEVATTGEILAGPELHVTEPLSGEIGFEAVASEPMVLGLWLRDLDRQTIHAGRYWLANGSVRAVTPFRNLPPGRYGASVVAQYLYGRNRTILHAVDATLRTQSAPVWKDARDTYLPKWNSLQRSIHSTCKRSPAFNAFVQGIEFRLGREELLSMPRYMSFCPTGQCNALCDFCSVTINRTGIVKKQIDEALIKRFTQPVQRTISMYGLEGNGEPTLHRGFPNLARDLTAGDSEAYLITNGSRFSEDLIPALMRLESINVSLNAATAQTHRAVMKLKEHDIVVDGLKRIVAARGFNDPTIQVAANPRVSVSFVVTRQNAHEVEDFLAMAEDDIGADVAFVRPLSELGNETGTVEDLRDIVPYASDIEDLLEAVANYEKTRQRRMEIRCDPTAFKSVRPDPIGQIARPPGFENRLLAPRPMGWRTSSTDIAMTWVGATSHIQGAAPRDHTWEATSSLIPVVKGETLRLTLASAVETGAIELTVEGPTPNSVVWRRSLRCGDDAPIDALIPTQGHAWLFLRMRVSGEIRAKLDFERLRTATAPTESAENVLRASRWEVGGPSADAEFRAGAVKVSYDGEAGPYIAKSYAVPTQPGSRLKLELDCDVGAGELGVGILSGDQSTWLATGRTTGGRIALEALTGQQRAFRVVLFAVRDGHVAANVDTARAQLTCEEILEDEHVAPSSLAETGPLEEAPSAEPEAAPVEPPLRLVKLEEPTSRKRVYFCHKPWSDLHNFTVDGRMDVCCIATGPSQERYALGNLRDQNFQDAWNGATARLFRRSVNSDEVLPPCARCPMGYSYQGLWMERGHTLAKIEGWVWQQRIFQLPILRRIPRYFLPTLLKVIDKLAFDNFKR